MTLIDDIIEITNRSFEEVVASSLSLKLLKCYSVLYLAGAQPRWCKKSQLKYYQELIKNGIEMAKNYEKAKERTCKPAWKGLKYLPQEAKHFNSELLTDEQAVTLLQRGHLKETDFIKLPEGYKIPASDITEVKQKPKPRAKKGK